MVPACVSEKVYDAQVVLKQSEVPYVHQSISQLLIRNHLVCDVESASIRPFEHYLVLIQPLGPGSKPWRIPVDRDKMSFVGRILG